MGPTFLTALLQVALGQWCGAGMQAKGLLRDRPSLMLVKPQMDPSGRQSLTEAGLTSLGLWVRVKSQ